MVCTQQGHVIKMLLDYVHAIVPYRRLPFQNKKSTALEFSGWLLIDVIFEIRHHSLNLGFVQCHFGHCLHPTCFLYNYNSCVRNFVTTCRDAIRCRMRRSHKMKLGHSLPRVRLTIRTFRPVGQRHGQSTSRMYPPHGLPCNSKGDTRRQNTLLSGAGLI
jgi:hypothetical protein